MTTSTDRQWLAESAEGLDPARRLLHHVSEEVLAFAVEREHVARTLLGVKNLLEPPSAFLRPGILLPALWRTALSLLGVRKDPPHPRAGARPTDVGCFRAPARQTSSANLVPFFRSGALGLPVSIVLLLMLIVTLSLVAGNL